MEIKYFWGVKKGDGEVVAIVDLSDSERGLKCGCVCPICHTDFIARMGEIRTAHFAHSGNGCDVEKANMTGLYQLVFEYLSKNPFPLPTVGLHYNLTQFNVPITEFNAEQRIEVVSPYFSSIKGEPLIKEPIMWQFESPVVSFSAKGYPDAIIETVNNKKLALCIIPPSTVCKTVKSSAYDNDPTVILDLSSKDFTQLSRQYIFESVMTNPSFFRWIHYPKAKRFYPSIYERSRSECERIKTERLRRQQEQTAHKPIPPKQSNPKQDAPKRSYFAKKYISREYMTPELLRRERQLVLDDATGFRFGVCDICGKVTRDSAFSKLPINPRYQNIGICIQCAKQGK